MLTLAKVYHPVSLSCMNSKTVFRTECLTHAIFLNYIITISNTYWLCRAGTSSFLVCVDRIPKKFSYFSIRLLINCRHIQLGKNAMLRYIQNFREKKSMKNIRSAWHLYLPLQIHSLLCATIDWPIEIHYQMSCALHFQLGRPKGTVKEEMRARSGLPDSLPLKPPRPGCTSWEEGTTALKMAYSTQLLLVLKTSPAISPSYLGRVTFW